MYIGGTRPCPKSNQNNVVQNNHPYKENSQRTRASDLPNPSQFIGTCEMCHP
jgi:hypothetical protein